MASESKTGPSEMEDVDSLCAQGFVELPSRVPRGVLKKILRHGVGDADDHPVTGCPCFVQCVGRVATPDGPIFHSTRDVVDGKYVGGTDDPIEFQLKRGETLEGINIAVASMIQGELACFRIHPELAYGAHGNGGKVPPHSVLWYELELVKFTDALPPLPPPETMEQRKARQLEEAKRMAEGCPSADERLTKGMAYKDLGNEALKAGDLEAAKKHYDMGFVHICVSRDEVDAGTVSEKDLDQIGLLRGTLHLNRALVNLKLGNLQDAMWDCDRALLTYPKNAKAFYRRAAVREKQIRETLAKEDKHEFWDPERVAVLVQHARDDLKAGMRLAPDDLAFKQAASRIDALEARRLVYVARAEKAAKCAFAGRIFKSKTRQGGGGAESTADQEIGASSGSGGGDVYADMPDLEEL